MTGSRSLIAAAAFVALALVPALAQTGETPPTLDGAKTVTAAEAKALIDKGATALDARAEKAFGEGRLPKARSIRAAHNAQTREVDAKAFGDNKDAVLVVYGHGTDGWTAVDSVKSAVKAGFKNVNWMREGWAGWTKAGLPTEK